MTKLFPDAVSDSRKLSLTALIAKIEARISALQKYVLNANSVDLALLQDARVALLAQQAQPLTDEEIGALAVALTILELRAALAQLAQPE